MAVTRRLLFPAILGLWAVAVFPAACSRQPGNAVRNLAASPAVGTWKKGGMSYRLEPDGTGEFIIGRHHHPLHWSEDNGVVTTHVRYTDTPAADERGLLSPDKHSLTITETTSKTWLLGWKTTKMNQTFQKVKPE